MTFDDGFNNFKTVILPILEKYEIPSMIFVTTNYIDQKKLYNFVEWKKNGQKFSTSPDINNEDLISLTSEEIMFLNSHPLVEIGAHTCSHISLPRLPILDAKKEILESKIFLEKITKSPVKYFSFPYGEYSKELIHFVSKHFRFGFTINRGTNSKKSNTFMLRRNSIGMEKKLNNFKKNIFGIYDFIRLFDWFRNR